MQRERESAAAAVDVATDVFLLTHRSVRLVLLSGLPVVWSRGDASRGEGGSGRREEAGKGGRDGAGRREGRDERRDEGTKGRERMRIPSEDRVSFMNLRRNTCVPAVVS